MYAAGKDNKNFDRKTDGTVQNGENREQRYNRNNNRKTRENQQPLNNADGTAPTGNNNRSGNYLIYFVNCFSSLFSQFLIIDTACM